jgi:hypothetical protein
MITAADLNLGKDAQIVGQDKYANGSYTPSPVATPAPLPSIADQMAQNDAAVRNNTSTPQPVSALYGGFTKTPEQAEYDAALASKTENSRKQAAGEPIVDEAGIRAAALANMQAEIDANNTMYANKLAQAKIAGQGRLGTATAVNARRGLLGSDFGNANFDTVNSANNDIYGNIESERNAAELAFLTKARDAGTADIAAKTKAKIEGVDAYVKNLTDSMTRKSGYASDTAKHMIALGLDPTANADFVTRAANSYGISPDAIKEEYATQKKTKDEADKKLALEQAKTQAQIDLDKANATKAGNTDYTLGQGQTRFDGKGNKLASVAPRPVLSKPMLPGVYSINNATSNKLAGYGLNANEIAQIQNDARTHGGITNVLQNMKTTNPAMWKIVYPILK